MIHLVHKRAEGIVPRVYRACRVGISDRNSVLQHDEGGR